MVEQVVVGIDVSKAKLDVALLPGGEQFTVSTGCVPKGSDSRPKCRRAPGAEPGSAAARCWGRWRRSPGFRMPAIIKWTDGSH